VYIDKGESSGIKPDMAVITVDGVVGKVLHVYRSTSLVLLINDQTSGVGAILEKTRLQGILRGTPAGEIVLEKVMSDEAVPVGELVLTSGGDRIFPKGLPVGRVTKVSPGSDLFLNISVKPAMRLPTVPPKPQNAPGGAAGPASPGSPAKPTADATKPKVPPPATATSGSAPVAGKAVTPASSSANNVSKAAAGTSGAKPSPKPAKSATEPKPQPAAQDPPQ
jgi:rod shape-determining protein MreC